MIILVILVAVRFLILRPKKYKLIKLNVSLGQVGNAEFVPNDEDIQIAHKIWTELVTRKAALPIDPDNDVIVDIYDSWYALFTRIRELISDIPADLIRNEESTRQLVKIATSTLNQGLRPHLTKWQARFRNWYQSNSEKLKNVAPQELQREFPEYDCLISELKTINEGLIAYSKELKKIVNGMDA